MTHQEDDFKFTRDSIALACSRARDAVVSNFSPHFLKWEITEQQWRVMRILHENEQLSLSELCQHSCIHKASMSRIITTLIERGWVNKQRDQVDTRSFNINLTEEGYQFVLNAQGVGHQIYEEIYQKYGRQKVKLLLEMLHDLEVVRKSG